MAQRVVTQLISDLSGEEIKSGKGESIEFAYRGVSYRIDLTNKEAAGFDKVIATYLEHATKTSGRRKTSAASSKSGYVAKDVRAWAAEQGIDVPARGRIAADVVEKYQAAT
ncbi:histone-like nucleoid-structuring protein Lsr2 [Nocardioides humi]|uniref:Lsr2 family protein n=1 Tax=Nocardioides humi TaxID=449461 RepID=A0ABN2BXC6_9ACTN|nr:Lsr2 family protein [Nocardioides humi]